MTITMSRLRFFLLGTLFGLLLAALLALLAVRNLAGLLVVDQRPIPADAIVVLGGESNGTRLLKGLQLHDDRLAPRLILVGRSRQSWDAEVRKLPAGLTLEGRDVIYLEGSRDTRTDAQLTRDYGIAHGLRTLLVVTSPYHTRRAQLVFDDIFAGSGIDQRVISSGDYGPLLPPDSPWWRNRTTIEAIWLEFGKVLYWELTPFEEFQGEGR